MKNKNKISTFLLLLALFLIAPFVVLADYELDDSFSGDGIVIHNNAAGGNNNDIGYDVAVDSNGNVFIAGSSDNASDDTDLALWKYDSNGNLASGFPKTHNNAAGGNDDDVGLDIIIDDSDNIYIVGSSYSASNDYDLALWKYDSNGNLASGFPKTHNNAAGGNDDDVGYAVGIDSTGNVFIAGYSENASSDTDLALWKYDSNGNLASGFPKTHNSAAGGNDDDVGYRLTIDSGNNIYISGSSENVSDNSDLALWKYDSNGNLASGFPKTQDYASDDDTGYDLVISEGNIFIAGFVTNISSNLAAALWKYDLNGNLASGFPKTHNGAAGGNDDVALGIGADSSGDLFLSGASKDATDEYDLALWKYDSNGNLASDFPKTHNSAAGGNGVDIGYYLIINSDDIYIAGASDNTAGNTDMVLWKYSSESETATLSGYFEIKDDRYANKRVYLYSSGGRKIQNDKTNRRGLFNFKDLSINRNYFVVASQKKKITAEKYFAKKLAYEQKYAATFGDDWLKKFEKKYITEEKKDGLRYYRKYRARKKVNLTEDKEIQLELK